MQTFEEMFPAFCDADPEAECENVVSRGATTGQLSEEQDVAS